MGRRECGPYGEPKALLSELVAPRIVPTKTAVRSAGHQRDARAGWLGSMALPDPGDASRRVTTAP